MRMTRRCMQPCHTATSIMVDTSQCQVPLSNCDHGSAMEASVECLWERAGHTSGTISALTVPPPATVSAKILKPHPSTAVLMVAMCSPYRRSGLSEPYLQPHPLS